jgi:hypothetical protein
MIAAPKSVPAHRDITEAVRDTVTVRGSSDYTRTRVGRSQTALSVVLDSSSSTIITNSKPKTEPQLLMELHASRH